MNEQAFCNDIAAKYWRAFQDRDWSRLQHWKCYISRCLPARRDRITLAIEASRPKPLNRPVYF